MLAMSVRTTREPKHPIGSVDNALKLLLMFRDHPTIRISEASDALGVGRSTGHRLMAMLELHGFVEQDPQTKAYASGPALREIGLRVVHQMDVRSHLRPYLEQLVRRVNETVHLTVLDGNAILFLDGIECTRPVRTGLRIGISRPAHCTAAGKVLLAFLSLEELRELYPSPRLTACTPYSLKTRSALERELAEVRELGYSITVGESEPDVAAVGVAVRDSQGRARAALGISFPRARFDDRYARELLSPLQDTAAAAGRDLA
jgi:IclR family transcriptional regulator, acetate operon repressor